MLQTDDYSEYSIIEYLSTQVLRWSPTLSQQLVRQSLTPPHIVLSWRTPERGGSVSPHCWRGVDTNGTEQRGACNCRWTWMIWHKRIRRTTSSQNADSIDWTGVDAAKLERQTIEGCAD